MARRRRAEKREVLPDARRCLESSADDAGPVLDALRPLGDVRQQLVHTPAKFGPVGRPRNAATCPCGMENVTSRVAAKLP